MAKKQPTEVLTWADQFCLSQEAVANRSHVRIGASSYPKSMLCNLRVTKMEPYGSVIYSDLSFGGDERELFRSFVAHVCDSDVIPDLIVQVAAVSWQGGVPDNSGDLVYGGE